MASSIVTPSSSVTTPSSVTTLPLSNFRAQVFRALDAAVAVRGALASGTDALGALTTGYAFGRATSKHGVPTIVLRGSTKGLIRCVADSNEELCRRYQKHAPFLAGFDFSQHGLVLAGETAGRLLTEIGDEWTDYAYDFYFVSGKVDEASDVEETCAKAITALGDHALKHSPEVEVYRSADRVTFRGSCGMKIQVFLRSYKCIAELLMSFDLGSDQIAWDTHHVHLTELGRLAVEDWVNIVDLAGRRAGYEARILAAMCRGYFLVAPGLGTVKPGITTITLGALVFSGIAVLSSEFPLCLLAAECGLAPTPGAGAGAGAGAEDVPCPIPISFGALDAVAAASISAVAAISAWRGDALDKARASVVAGEPYTQGLDVRTICLRLPKSYADSLWYALSPERIDHRSLVRILGVADTLRIVHRFLGAGAATQDMIDQALDSRNKDLATLMPFRVPAAAATDSYVSAAEWYGQAWEFSEPQ